MIENKQLICQRLLDALVLSRSCEGLKSIEYMHSVMGNDDFVHVLFKNGNGYTLNVTDANGLEMIDRIVSAVYMGV